MGCDLRVRNHPRPCGRKRPDMKRELVRSVFQVIIIEKCSFLLGSMMVLAQQFRFTGAGKGFSSREGRESPPDGPFEPSVNDMRAGSRSATSSPISPVIQKRQKRSIADFDEEQSRCGRRGRSQRAAAALEKTAAIVRLHLPPPGV